MQLQNSRLFWLHFHESHLVQALFHDYRLFFWVGRVESSPPLRSELTLGSPLFLQRSVQCISDTFLLTEETYLRWHDPRSALVTISHNFRATVLCVLG